MSRNSTQTNLHNGISVVNGMLHFQDMGHVQSVMESLYQNYVIHDDNFLSSYPDLTSDELEAKEEEIGFRDYKTYEDFEEDLNFNSLRSHIEKQNEIYLDLDDDRLDDPDDHFIILDEERAILNLNAEVMIGKSIFKMFDWGYIEIPDADFNKLEIIRANPEAALIMDNVKIEGDIMDIRPGTVEEPAPNDGLTLTPACKGYKRSRDKEDFGSDARIKWKVAIRTLPWGRYVIAKSKNFLRKNSKWKKHRCQTKVRVWGSISGYEETENGNVNKCSIETQFKAQDGSNTEVNKKKGRDKVSVQTKTQTGWVKGWHSSFIGYSCVYESVLEFPGWE